MKWILSCLLLIAPLAAQVTFPNANGTNQAQNVVAGCNANVPTALCQAGSAANTTSTYSISSGIVTFNLVTAMASAFPVNGYVAISGCTVATNLNGLMVKANASTTTTALVGTVVNTQNTVQTPANVSSTTETNCYLQGPGWSPFYLAPFPAPGTYSCGAQGNGAAACSNAGTPAAVNNWSMDWANANPNGGAPVLPINMITDLNSKNKHSLFCGLTGETNDNCISLEDGISGTPGQFFTLQQSQFQQFTHGHWDHVGCGGNPCFIPDLISNANWYTPFAGGYVCGWQRALSQRPGANRSILYCFLYGNGGSGIGSNFDPGLYKCTVTYNGGSSPITGSCSLLYDIGTCPGWGYVALGSGSDCSGTGSCLGTALAATTQISVDNYDDEIQLGLGAGSQGTLNRNAQIIVSQARNKCALYDSAGYSGTNLGEVDYTPGSQGTGFAVNDTVTATSGSCTFTETVTQVSSGKILQLLSVNTTTSSAITGTGPGQTFTVSSDVGMYVGQTIFIDTGASLDNASITSCGTSTPHASCTSASITATLNKTHSSGVRVVSQSINNSGCAHAYNITPTSTSGSGNIGVGGLRLDIEEQGDPTTGTIWPFIDSAHCPLGTTTTCESPVVPIIDKVNNRGQAPYGAHSGNCERSGRYCYVSGYGATWQGVSGVPGGSWDTIGDTLFGSTNATFSGHPAIGFLFDGAASNPNYYALRFLDGGNCATPPPNLPQCYRVLALPAGCSSNPGGSDSHLSWVTLDNGQGYPFFITSTYNNGGFPGTMTDPPGWTCGYMSQFFASSQSGVTSVFSHWYTNLNNTNDNFQCSSAIYGMDPHGKFVLGLSDMNSPTGSSGTTSFAGNTGLGTSSDSSAPFCGMFAYTTGITGTPPASVDLTITGSKTINGNVIIQ